MSSPHRFTHRMLAAAAVSLAGLAAVGPRADDGDDSPHWSMPARLVEQSLLLDVDGNDQVVIVVGERGHILVSRDRGASWTQADVPTRSNLTAVDVVDQTHAWAVGHDAVVVHTDDGGVTWRRQHWDPELEKPLFDVWMQDRRRGFAIGAYGLYLETDDGGVTWEEREFDEEEPHLYLVDQAAGGRLYVVGEFGSIFRSDDLGEEWERCESPYGGSFFGVVAAGGDVLVFGLRGNIYRSTDAGASWDPVDAGVTTGLFAGTRLREGRILIAGQSGTLLVSTDQGRTFDVRNVGNRNAISAVFQQADGSLLLVGEGGIQTLQAVAGPDESIHPPAPQTRGRGHDPGSRVTRAAPPRGRMVRIFAEYRAGSAGGEDHRGNLAWSRGGCPPVDVPGRPPSRHA